MGLSASTEDDDDRVYLAAGEVVANKYRVDRILGVGGAGFVVAATHVNLGGLFALKFLKRRFLHDKTIGERFTHEARAAGRISSQYVARVYDVGSHDGAPFIVLEHLVGRDLRAVLTERGALGLRESAEYGVQACAALAVAHANGIVHLDIKPENLFVVDEQGLPTVKLLDFGISKFVLASGRFGSEGARDEEPITSTLVCGTPSYMSPEQMRSTAHVDARSDVWSLGVVLYELVASMPAFQAETVAGTCAAILETEPPRLDDVRPEVPPGFADVVARCLKKDPADRFPTVAELAIALLPFAPPRALDIAESSEWIRRAAIQTIGGVGIDAPVSSTPNVSWVNRPNPVPPNLSGAPPVTPSTPRPRWRGAATAVAVSLAAVGLYQWIGRGHHAARGEGATAGIEAPISLPAPETSTPVAPPSSSRELSSGAIPVGSSATPVRAAVPSKGHPTRTPPRGRGTSKAAAIPPSSFSASATGMPGPPSLDPQPNAWQTVTPPPVRTTRAIDSSNPWSTTQ
jgi:serine/threonine protein kinase